MSPIQSLVEDIEAALDDQTSDRRVALLHRITSLFIEQVPDLNEEHIGVFDDVILCLALEIEFHARVELSERLADLDRAPRGTIKNLALDPHINVAGPVLERSVCVDEEILVTIARERAPEFLRAVSRRRAISGAVTDFLIERGDHELVRAIAENRQSALSDHGLRLLAEKAVEDTRLYRVLKTRPDLATRHIGAILDAAKRRAKAEMRELAANDDALESALDTGTAAVLNNPGVLALTEALENADYAISMQEHRSLLTEQSVIECLKLGKIGEALAIVAHLAEMPRGTVMIAYGAAQFDPLLFIFRALNFDWKTFECALSAKHGGKLPERLRQSAHSSYHALTNSTATRVMRFIAARSNTTAAIATGG
ncbi:MAG: DUF2336 domain-containing protein [Hyphomicrobiales bacterium]